jgi:hypothetical protein
MVQAYGYIHHKKTRRKRKGRIAKSNSKRIPKKSKNRGQGR